MESSLRHILHSSNSALDLAAQAHRQHQTPSPPAASIRSAPGGTRHVQNPPGQTTTATSILNDSRKRPASRVKSSYPRKRAIQACQKCRVRRTKCNNVRPSCSSCLDLGAECIYSDGDPSTFDAASLAILEKLNALEDLIRDNNHDHHSPNTTAKVVAAEEADLDDSQASLLLLKHLASPTLERTKEAFSTHINIEAVLSWPVFEEKNYEVDLKRLLNANDDGFQQNMSIIGIADVENHAGEQLLQRYLDHVFIFNPILEETKVHKYMRDARFNGLGWDAPSCLLLLIYAHGSIAVPFDASQGSDSTTFRRTAEFKQAESFFSAAQKRMGLLLCKSGVVEAQCFFLAGAYLMATLRPLEAWKMFVQSLACCQGFYSEKRTHDMQNESEQRLQESIYWTCFKSELELRLELNVSEKSVWDLTYPAFFPSPPEGLKSQGEIVWYFYLAEIALRRLGNRILNYIYKCQPNVSTSLIADSIPSFEQQADGWIRSLPSALNLDDNKNIGDGINNTSGSSNGGSSSSPSGDGHGASAGENPLHSTLKFILNGHLLDCYEMMYWPFIVDAINSSHSNSNSTSTATATAAAASPSLPTPTSISAPASTSTSTSNPTFTDPSTKPATNTDPSSSEKLTSLAQKALQVCVHRILKNEPGFYHRHHGTWLMLRSCTRSALVLLGARRCGSGSRLATLMPHGWEDAIHKVLSMLAFWRNESRDVEERFGVVRGLVEELGVAGMGVAGVMSVGVPVGAGAGPLGNITTMDTATMPVPVAQMMPGPGPGPGLSPSPIMSQYVSSYEQGHGHGPAHTAHHRHHRHHAQNVRREGEGGGMSEMGMGMGMGVGAGAGTGMAVDTGTPMPGNTRGFI